MSAWITREWHEDGKRRRKKTEFGMRGVREQDEFVVEWVDPSGKRCRKKINATGREAKRLADDLAKQITAKLTLGTYESQSRIRWSDFRAEYECKVLAAKPPSTERVVKDSLNLFQRLCKPKFVDSIRTRTIDSFLTVTDFGEGNCS